MDQPTSVKRVPLFSLKSTRFIVCILMMLGLATTVSMRVNLSMAMVCMVNSTAFNIPSKSSAFSFSNVSDDECPNLSDGVSAAKAGYTGSLLWSPSMQSLLFSATFYGAIITTIFSGYMADRFGPKMLLLAVALDYVVVTLLTPLLTEWSYEAYFVGRVLMGLGEGFTFPCLSAVAAKWFTANERSSAAAIYTSGNQIAMIIVSVVSANLCSTSMGWPSIFYLFGSIGLLWSIVWLVVFSNHPSNNKWISKEENLYLSQHVPAHKKKHTSIPWRGIITSIPLWAAISCQFTFNLQAGLLQAFVPTYLKEELHIPLAANGLFTTIPFIGQLVSKNILGVIADHLKRKEIISHTTSAKTFQIIGSTGAAIIGVLLATVPNCHSPNAALWLLGGYGAFLTVGTCGFITAMLSMSPSHTGTIISISMIFGVLGNMCGPIIMSILNIIIPTHKWMYLFVVCSLLHFFTGLFFFFFGSADIQEWSEDRSKVEDATEVK